MLKNIFEQNDLSLLKCGEVMNVNLALDRVYSKRGHEHRAQGHKVYKTCLAGVNVNICQSIEVNIVARLLL